MKRINPKTRAFSLVEMLATIAVIGIISSIAIPYLSRLNDSSIIAKDTANAKAVERMSAALASLGVAHVIPDSLGGVEATARLLREGVTVPGGPMSGELFQIPSLSEEDIEGLSRRLRVQYDMTELRLIQDNTNSFFLTIPCRFLYCHYFHKSPVSLNSMLSISLPSFSLRF